MGSNRSREGGSCRSLNQPRREVNLLAVHAGMVSPVAVQGATSQGMLVHISPGMKTLQCGDPESVGDDHTKGN